MRDVGCGLEATPAAGGAGVSAGARRAARGLRLTSHSDDRLAPPDPHSTLPDLTGALALTAARL